MSPRTRVLIVDDEELFRISIAHNLQKRYLVFQAKDGMEALEVLANAKVDVVVTDLTMPRMDGFSLVKELHSRWPSVKLVALTCGADDRLLKVVKAAGVPAILEKPFKPEVLIEAIENTLDERIV